jgi:hypothetical protein
LSDGAARDVIRYTHKAMPQHIDLAGSLTLRKTFAQAVVEDDEGAAS